MVYPCYICLWRICVYMFLHVCMCLYAYVCLPRHIYNRGLVVRRKVIPHRGLACGQWDGRCSYMTHPHAHAYIYSSIHWYTYSSIDASILRIQLSIHSFIHSYKLYMFAMVQMAKSITCVLSQPKWKMDFARKLSLSQDSMKLWFWNDFKNRLNLFRTVSDLCFQ